MKFIHLSDLHLGKNLNGFSLIEDQEYILKKIINIVDKEKPDGIIIAGDIYDKSLPSTEAVKLFDEFLVSLADRKLKIFVISGNHDSVDRIAFGSRIMDKAGVYMSPVYDGNIKPIELKDEFGDLNIYLIPFVKPVNVRSVHEDKTIVSYTDAIKCIIEQMNIDTKKRNVLVAHQFVTGSNELKRAESETISTVGTLDNVDANIFAPFDYVALGHLHCPQDCVTGKIRYCGSPLKYSFSESKDQKSVTVVELLEKGNVSYKTVDLIPKRELVEIKGTYEQLTSKSFYENTTWQEDYTHITLTNEEEVLDAINRLRTIYHGLMKLDYDNKRTSFNANISADAEVKQKSPFELFEDFYELQNNQPMSEEQSEYMKDLIEKIMEEK